MSPTYIAIIVVGCAVLVGAICAFVWFSNNAFTVQNYTVKSAKAPKEGVKIVHLSDLHGKSFGKNNAKLISAIKAQNADYIVFTGDIIHLYRQRDISVALSLVRELAQIAPFIYVSGNHEMRNKNYSRLSKQIAECGGIVLDNSSLQMDGLTVVGLNCAFLRNDKIYEVTPDTQNFKLLLAHEPQYLKKYASAGYDLVLSGHAHGGQWRIPFTKVGIYSPGQGLFPKLISGEHTCGNTKMIISRGLGNSECPLRLFNRPEVLVITIL
jgi:hypothetical protein